MKRFLSIFLAVFALSLAACTSSDEENGNNSQGGGNQPSTQPEVTITTQPTPTVSAKGGKDTIAFHAEKPWSAKVMNTRADGWCSIYPTSGAAGDAQITITTTPNDTADDRTATIVIQAGSSSIPITITQKQANALTVTASKFEVDTEGGEVEIVVKANVDYDYTIDPDAAGWVKYKATRALESSTLVFEVAENEDMDKREAQIMIHSGDLEELVTIYQEGNEPTIILSKNEYTVSDKGETIAVDVRSNVDVAVEIPSDVDWIKENTTRAMSTNTFYLDVAPNEDYKSRSAAVKFTNKENGLSEIVMISQAQMDAIVIAKDSYTIDNEGGEIDIEVGHNVDFDIEISDSWITKTSTRAFETETLTFTIAANNSDDSREGTIKFISKDKSITQTVKVYQSQSNALIVSKKDIVIDEAAQTVEFEVRANVEYTVSDPSASWLHRESTRAMTSQTIRYHVDANSSHDSRTATITVQSKDGSLKETITVTQAQKDAIVLAKNSYTVDNDGGEIDIEVGHNVDFDIEISDSWITKTSTRAFETETLTFTIAANNSDDSREGTIKFISKDKSITQTVKVYQSQSNALIVSKKDIVIDEAAQTFEFEVRANVEYTISDPSASWLHRESTRAMTSQTIHYRVDANSSYDSRTATITVQSKDGSLKETITVTQAQKDAIVLAKNSYTVDNDGGEIDIEVGHNVDFDIEISDSWITKTSTRAFETETLTFTIAANNSDDSREGTIKFISKDKSITQTVKIEQESNYNPTKPRNNEIWYTSTDGKIVTPHKTDAFGANIVSNTCEDGKGVITFDGNVTNIGDRAFEDCRSLTSITIPDSVIEIGDYAFCGCDTLTSITIPDSVNKIERGAFAYCESLKAVYGKFATADNRALIVNGVLNTFAIACGATSYTIPDSVTKIGGYAFNMCRSLTSITIPDSVTWIESFAFASCSSLASITIPNSVSIIGSYAFDMCRSLTSITIPNSIISIGNYTFYRCSSLTSVYCKPTQPPTAEYNGYSSWYTFYDNASDRKIYVPKNSVAAYKAADGWKDYADAIVADTSGDDEQDDEQDPTKPRKNEIWYTSTNGKIIEPYATNGFGANIVSNTYENGKGIIKFDNDVKQVGFDAFWQCANIKSITLPEGIESLGDSSFYQCENLEHIDIPDSVMSIGRFVFCYCYGLKDITIPNGVISIGQATFAHCTGLTTITLPESVSEVGEGLFSECSNLTSFYGKFATADHSSLIANGTFIALAMNSGLTEVYVPEGVTAIGMGAFRKNSNLSFVSLPSSLTRIGAYAFQYCQNLSNVAIPEQVYSIGYWAFFNCESFTSVTIPNSVTELAEGAFSYCYNIQEFHGKYTTSDHCCLIVDGRLEAFAVKSGVTSYVIPNTVSEIPDGVFSTCPSISELTIPESVNKIGNYAFQVCSNLKSIRLKSTTPPTIFDATFSNVRSSFIIYVPSGCANIYKNADIWENHRSIILEEGEEIYSSSDYSQDGKVTKLQSATKGNGIDIVLMGDAFTDRLIADGTYEKTMRTAMEKFFTEEPYKSYRDHFNVYSVTAVSKNDIYGEIYGEGYETAFSGFFGGGTHVGGDNAKVLQYTQKAISDDRIDKSLMIVMMNSTSYAGTCYMYYTDSGDYGNGASISYFPIGADETALEQVLHHEAGGHGFAKLGDEYAYEEFGTIPAEEVQGHAQMEPYGWWKNADFTNDPKRVKWAHFLSDTRYAYDGLGVFEGGLTFWRGVWRPTENSIMRYNTGGFNAPSREAIYYRIHKLAYGESWQYDYEKFVEWDAKNRKTAATRGVPYRIEQPKDFKPLTPPVVINHSWRDAR